ncbi:hypothetical protein CI1B_32820 [Bradyrhizobium ivorense]|uniref:T6SS Transcription factor RovC-like DNA binding domain-containing protein n=2 Tax=Bradyrhizobium ivorense TaxID=2511166 RepID=A0A508TCV7_9BRAD|nr:hypothetical protein CI1B_32820 [Bradyrhizobium ivorense]
MQCQVLTGDLRKPTAASRRQKLPTWPGSGCAGIATTKRPIGGYLAMNVQKQRRASSGGSGGSRFPADPQKTFDKQTVFWAPEVLPTVLALRAANCVTPEKYQLDFANLPGSELRRAPDGWHAIVPLGGAKHRLWLSKLPTGGSAVVLDLPLDASFELRLQAARRFWLALEHRPLGTPPLALPALKRRRLILALRALDGWQEGNSYRQIAQGLFGSHRIADRGWKTDDLRSRTIRLVKLGRRLLRLRCRAFLQKGRRRNDSS